VKQEKVKVADDSFNLFGEGG